MPSLRTATAPVVDWIARPDRQRLDRYVALAITVVFASLYVLGKEGRILFYFICLLPMVLYLRPAVIREVSGNWYWRLSIALCALWLVSIAWSGDSATWESVYDAGRIGIQLAVFTTAAIAVAVRGHLQERRLLDCIAMAAGITGAVVLALAWHPMMYWEGTRLSGFGWAIHPGIGGDIYAFAGLVALVRVMDDSDRRRRILAAAVVAVCFTFVVLSESRGSVLALLGGLMALGLVRKPWMILGVLGATAGVAVLASALGAIDFGQWIARGPTHRVDIWQQTLARILAHPLLGAGAAAPLEVASHNSAHNIFLSVQYNMGVPGSLLFLALTLLAFGHGWTLARRGQPLYFTLLAFGYAVMLTHTQTVFIELSREWLIFWLPIVLLSGKPGQPALGRAAPA